MSHSHPPSASSSTAMIGGNDRAALPSQRSNVRLSSLSRKIALPGWMKMSRQRAEMIVAFSMIVLTGMNDSSTGANLSSMQATYGVSYEQISLVFLSNIAGYFASCMSSSFILESLGLQRSLLIAAFSLASGCLMLAFTPPYPVFVSSLAFLGFGSGLYDSSLTTVISHEEDGTLMSLMYSCFGIGAFASPLLVGGLIDHNIPWNKYYYIPFSLSIVLAIIGYPVFSKYRPPTDDSVSTAPIPLADLSSTVESQIAPGERAVISGKSKMLRVLRLRAVWVGFILSTLAFASLDTLSAWLVSFMIQKRESPEAASRYLLSGLWGGIALGRIVLASLGRKLGEKKSSVLALTLTSAALGVVWGYKSMIGDALALAFTGFFMGPIAPGILSAISSRVPASLKSSAMSLTIGIGLIGSSGGPLLFGVVANKGGLASLPAVLIGTSVLSVVGWLLLPVNTRRED